MKNVQVFLALLLFTASAFGVTVSCTDEGEGVVRIDYDASGENSMPLAFALDITVDNGATIDVISDYISGDSTASAPGYGIFPRSIIFDDTGRISDWGFPDVEPAADAVGVQPGLGTKGITIELATRYAGAENAPLTKGMLCKIEVNNNGAEQVNVNVSANIAGGGVVMENATVANMTAVGCTLNFSGTPVNKPPVISSLTASSSSIYEDQTSNLQALASDPDDGPSPLSYNWIVPAGAGSVANSTGSGTTYYPPDVATMQLFTVTVEVSDGQESVIDTVNITVYPKTPEPDTITITKATYKVGDKELLIDATSSAQPDSTLTVAGYGTMAFNAGSNGYELRIKPAADPSGTITVTSSLNGTATKSVIYEIPSLPDTITITKADYKVGDKELVIDATSSAQPGATLTVAGYGTMTYDADGNKYKLRAKPVSDPGGTITVSSSLDGTATKSITYKDVPDETEPDTITITKAEYKIRTRELKVYATSSAQPDSVLTVAGVGKMTWNAQKKRYELKLKPTGFPGFRLTVTSDIGGSATRNLSPRFR